MKGAVYETEPRGFESHPDFQIEYKDELTDIPDFCGEEITGQREYSNITIAIKNGDR